MFAKAKLISFIKKTQLADKQVSCESQVFAAIQQ